MTPPDPTSTPVGEASASPASTPKRTKWPRYVEAVNGLAEHWYAAIFSDEVTEGAFVPITLLGKSLLLTRSGGQVYAISDRCAHRGVKFSVQPLCFKEKTLSCWYHGWTYSLGNGEVTDILTSPNSPIIGKVKIPVYATEEAKGLVFVFVGEGEPHPLQDDVPPGFLDPETHALGIRRRVKSNWRLGAENGIDSTHIFIHRNSVLIEANNLAIPFGVMAESRASTTFTNKKGEWPKGIEDHMAEGYYPLFDAKIGGETVLQYLPGPDAKRVAANVSLWLPGVLKVDPWPDPSLIQYEFYVPVNESEHEYFQLLQKKVDSEADIEEFRRDFDEKWRDLALHGFNDDDVWAREATEEFYCDGEGWFNEHLFPPDTPIVMWRQLVSEQARGVQP